MLGHGSGKRWLPVHGPRGTDADGGEGRTGRVTVKPTLSCARTSSGVLVSAVTVRTHALDLEVPMHKNFTRAGVVALVAPVVLAAGTMPAAGDPGGPDRNGKSQAGGSSRAQIDVVGCVVESDKEISYIAFLRDGAVIEKDESIGTETYDLREADVDGFDSVKVKSGTSVHEEAVGDTCDEATGTTQDDGDQGAGADGERPDGQPGGSQDTRENKPANSATTIERDGCRVVAGKEISYVAFFDAGELVTKDESIGREDFDLSTVGFDFDEIEVKAGTTVKVIGVGQDCESPEGSADGDTDAGNADDATGDDGADGNGGVVGSDDDRKTSGDTPEENRGGDDRDEAAQGNRDGNGGSQPGEVAGEQRTGDGDVDILGVEQTTETPSAAVPTVVAAGVGAEALPQTGAEDNLVMLGAVGLGLLALGGAAMVIRRRLGTEL